MRLGNSGHIHILHLALVLAMIVVTVVIIADVVTQTNLVGAITNLFDKVANMVPHR